MGNEQFKDLPEIYEDGQKLKIDMYRQHSQAGFGAGLHARGCQLCILPDLAKAPDHI